MALGYIAALKLVPWEELLRNAPTIIDGSRKLWRKVGKSEQPQALTGDARLAELEAQVQELQKELTSAAELVNALAEQNSHLVAAVAALRVRARQLLAAVVVLALASGGIAAFVFAQSLP